MKLRHVKTKTAAKPNNSMPPKTFFLFDGVICLCKYSISSLCLLLIFNYPSTCSGGRGRGWSVELQYASRQSTPSQTRLVLVMSSDICDYGYRLTNCATSPPLSKLEISNKPILSPGIPGDPAGIPANPMPAMAGLSDNSFSTASAGTCPSIV